MNLEIEASKKLNSEATSHRILGTRKFPGKKNALPTRNPKSTIRSSQGKVPWEKIVWEFELPKEKFPRNFFFEFFFGPEFPWESHGKSPEKFLITLGSSQGNFRRSSRGTHRVLPSLEVPMYIWELLCGWFGRTSQGTSEKRKSGHSTVGTAECHIQRSQPLNVHSSVPTVECQKKKFSLKNVLFLTRDFCIRKR